MADEHGWDKAKELITYRLDEIQKSSESIKVSVESLSTQFADLKAELAAKVATKEELEILKYELHEVKLQYATDIAQLKIQAGVWGALAGLVPVVLALGVAAIGYFVT